MIHSFVLPQLAAKPCYRGIIAALFIAMTAELAADVDMNPPSVAITSPVPDSTISGRSFGAISGTAADDAGVVGVDLKITRVSDGKFWDGVAGWSATSVVLPTSFDANLGTW